MIYTYNKIQDIKLLLLIFNKTLYYIYIIQYIYTLTYLIKSNHNWEHVFNISDPSL